MLFISVPEGLTLEPLLKLYIKISMVAGTAPAPTLVLLGPPPPATAIISISISSAPQPQSQHQHLLLVDGTILLKIISKSLQT